MESDIYDLDCETVDEDDYCYETSGDKARLEAKYTGLPPRMIPCIAEVSVTYLQQVSVPHPVQMIGGPEASRLVGKFTTKKFLAQLHDIDGAQLHGGNARATWITTGDRGDYAW